MKDKFTIERSKWRRGGDKGGFLLNAGKKCCLGFYMNHLGYTDEQIQGKYLPSCVMEGMDRQHWLLERSRDVHESNEEEIAYANDTEELQGLEREEEIKRLFAHHDVEVEFVD